MRTFTALLSKYIMTLVFAWLTFGAMGGNPIGRIAATALVAAAANYLVGDLLVLPTLGNVVAAVGDGIMGALVFYLAVMMNYLPQVSVTSILVFGVLVAVGEFFFHRYLTADKTVAP